MFSGGVSLSHNTVNELCYRYVPQIVKVLWPNKKPPLNVVFSEILYENNDIFKTG
jgi:hypothetical protein